MRTIMLVVLGTLCGDGSAATTTAGRRFERHTLGYDPAADIDAIGVPSLWLYGEADVIIPVEASIARVLAARANPPPVIVTLPDAGHSFAIDRGAIPVLAERCPAVVIEWTAAFAAAPQATSEPVTEIELHD